MSYPNLIMLFKTIPSYEKEEKSDGGKEDDDVVDINDLGDYINRRRQKNALKKKGKK